MNNKPNSGSFKKGHKTWNKGMTSSTNYRQLHKWLRRNLGSANKCQNKDCDGTSKFFDWAKLPDKKYVHSLTAYIQLCRKCHKLMDYWGKKLKIVYV